MQRLPAAFGLLAAVHEWIREIEGEMRLATTTVEQYRTGAMDYAHYAATRGVRDWRAADEACVRGYVAGLRERGAAPATARLRLSTVRAFHGWLAEHGRTGASPAARVRSPRVRQVLPPTLTVAEVQCLLESVAGEDPLALRDRALLEFLYGSGARSAEARTLTLEALSLEHGTARLIGKGWHDRVVPIGDAALRALWAYLTDSRPRVAQMTERAVFVSYAGTALSEMGLWKIVQRRSIAAGLTRHVHAHMLRHSFATHLVQGGADVRAVQLLLGHASISSTQVYLRHDDRWLREVHAKCHPRG